MQALLVVFWLVVFLSGHRILKGHVEGILHLAALYLLLVPILVAWYLFILPRWHHSFRDSKVALRICPSCDYDLSKHNQLQDGFVVCPECGAAWAVGQDDSQRSAQSA